MGLFGMDVRRILASLSALAACMSGCGLFSKRVEHPGRVRGASPFSEAGFGFAPPDLGRARGVTLWATYYSIPRVSVATVGGFPLTSMAGQRLGPYLERRDWCDAAMEGTVQVEEGQGWKTYNYAGTRSSLEVDCTAFYPKHPAIGRSRFKPAIGPFGDGARGWRLVPFRSIAVDQKIIPHGSVVYIPSARGVEVKLPLGGTALHDGYFFAADTGGAIKGSHIDVFIGPRRKNPFPFIQSKPTATFEAFVVDDPVVTSVLANAHGTDLTS